MRAQETLHDGLSALPLHRHRQGYIALVREGRYEEVSPDGRYVCEVGAIVSHPRFHAHRNRFSTAGARVLNLPMPVPLDYQVVASTHVEELARLAERDPLAAAMGAVEELSVGHTRPVIPPPWLKQLARALRQDASRGDCRRIGALTAALGVSSEHASRTFAEWFGLTPSRYRREHRIRHAVFLLEQGVAPAHVALATGFSDQAHLTRALKKTTGGTSKTFKPGASES
ncbi:MAG: helix-turn-helix transcriptional regulator [Myxococcota bacterium]